MAYVEVGDTVNRQLIDKDTLNQVLENIRWLYDERPRYFYQRPYVDADYTTTSTTLEDIDATNLYCSITTTGNPVRVRWGGMLLGSTTVASGFELLVDGAAYSNDASWGLGGPTGIGTTGATRKRLDMEVVVPLAAGTHTFKLQWRTNTGTLTFVVATGIQFEVYEI